jgi:hypothetical protein
MVVVALISGITLISVLALIGIGIAAGIFVYLKFIKPLQGISGKATEILGKAEGVITSSIKNIKDTFEPIQNLFKELIKESIPTVKNFANFIGELSTKQLAIVNSLVSTVQTVMDKGTKTFDTVLNASLKNFEKGFGVFSKSIENIQTVAEKVTNLSANGIENVSKIVDAIVGTLTNTITTFLKVLDPANLSKLIPDPTGVLKKILPQPSTPQNNQQNTPSTKPCIPNPLKLPDFLNIGLCTSSGLAQNTSDIENVGNQMLKSFKVRNHMPYESHLVGKSLVDSVDFHSGEIDMTKFNEMCRNICKISNKEIVGMSYVNK